MSTITYPTKGLNGRGGVAIAELIVYSPCFCASAYLLYRHGYHKKLGWYFLILFAALRLIGAAILVNVETTQPDNEGLWIAAGVFEGVGLSALILAMLGFLQRINDNMTCGPVVPTRVFRFINLPLLAGLGLSIAGGVYADDPENSPSTISSGFTYLKAGRLLFLGAYALLLGVMVLTLTRYRYVDPTEKKLLLAVLISSPFIVVRLVYSVIYPFDPTDGDFNPFSGSVYIYAFMGSLMEFIPEIAFIVAGFLTPPIPKANRGANVVRSTPKSETSV